MERALARSQCQAWHAAAAAVVVVVAAVVVVGGGGGDGAVRVDDKLGLCGKRDGGGGSCGDGGCAVLVDELGAVKPMFGLSAVDNAAAAVVAAVVQRVPCGENHVDCGGDEACWEEAQCWLQAVAWCQGQQLLL